MTNDLPNKESQLESFFAKSKENSAEKNPTPNTNKVEKSADKPSLSSQEETKAPLLEKHDKLPLRQRLFNTRAKKVAWVIGIIFIIFGLVLGIIGVYTFGVAMELRNQANEAQTTANNAYISFKSQNLPGAEAETNKLKDQLSNIKSTYSKLGFYSYIPIARNYYFDGEHALNGAEAGLNATSKTIAAITPYADVLGFAGEEFEGGSAENRIKLILETLDKVTPILDEIQADLDQVNSELSHINENRYPEQLRGQAIRSRIIEVKELARQADTLLSDYRPIIEQIPDMAGSTGERRKYLVLFQNDNELRPTGGFLTAYSVIYVEDGVVTPEKSDDIYELDQKFNKRIPIPEALGRYLTTERYWNLRDMNTSPDFKTSMEQFFEHYQDVPGEPDSIDGIIAVDTEFLTDLVEVVGPIEAPGYGTFSAENDPRCDCPQIIYALSEIITRPTPYLREDRKGILGPLMQAILGKVYSSPRTYMADMFNIFLEDVEGRHIQMYFLEENKQMAVEAINAAGRLDQRENVQDFLAIVNANLGGAKSNLFIDYEVLQEVSAPSDGKITKTVEITYKNDRRADNCNLEAGLLCLNSTLRDWTRLYIPEGSELVDAQGFTEEAKVYNEAGFTVIDGFFILEPQAQAKLRITYTVPYTDETYKVELWKQGGVDPIPMVMDVTGGQEQVLVDKDQVYETIF